MHSLRIVYVLLLASLVLPLGAATAQDRPGTRPAQGGSSGSRPTRPSPTPGGPSRPQPQPTRPSPGNRPQPQPTRPNPGIRPQPQPTRPSPGNRPQPQPPRPNPGNRPQPQPPRPSPGNRPNPGNRPGSGHRPGGRPPNWGRPPQSRPSYHFRPSDRDLLRRHYLQHFAYINRARRPIFLAGGFFPYADIGYLTPVPFSLYGAMPPIPPGYQAGYFDGYVVVYDPFTYFIADVLDLLQ